MSKNVAERLMDSLLLAEESRFGLPPNLMFNTSRSKLSSESLIAFEGLARRMVNLAVMKYNLDMSSFAGFDVVKWIGRRKKELSCQPHADNGKDVWAFVHERDDGLSIIISDRSVMELLNKRACTPGKLLHEMVHVSDMLGFRKVLGSYRSDLTNHVLTSRLYWMEYNANKIGNRILSNADAVTDFLKLFNWAVEQIKTTECCPLTQQEQAVKDQSFPIERITKMLAYAFGTLDSLTEDIRIEWEAKVWGHIQKHGPGWLTYLQETLRCLRDVQPYSATMFSNLEDHFLQWVYPPSVSTLDSQRGSADEEALDQD